MRAPEHIEHPWFRTWPLPKRGLLPSHIPWPPPPPFGDFAFASGVLYVHEVSRDFDDWPEVDIYELRRWQLEAWSCSAYGDSIERGARSRRLPFGAWLGAQARPAPDLTPTQWRDLSAPERRVWLADTVADYLTALSQVRQPHDLSHADAWQALNAWWSRALFDHHIGPFLPEGFAEAAQAVAESADDAFLLRPLFAYGNVDAWLDLLKSTPLLAVMMAREFANRDPADVVQNWAPLVWQSQTAIVGALGWPAMPRTIKLLRKWWVVGRAQWLLDYLRRHLDDSSCLPHLQHIPNVLQRYPELMRYVGALIEAGAHPKLIAGLLAEGDVDAYERLRQATTVWRRVLDLAIALEETVPLAEARSRNDLDRLRAALVRKAKGDSRPLAPTAQAAPPMPPEPPPTLHGATHLDTIGKVVLEGDRMANCSGSMLDRFQSDANEQLWHVDAPRPATLHLRFEPSQRRWTLVEAREYANAAPSSDLRAALETWLSSAAERHFALESFKFAPVALPLLPGIRPVGELAELLAYLPHWPDVPWWLPLARAGHAAWFEVDNGTHKAELVRVTRVRADQPWTMATERLSPSRLVRTWHAVCAGLDDASAWLNPDTEYLLNGITPPEPRLPRDGFRVLAAMEAVQLAFRLSGGDASEVLALARGEYLMAALGEDAVVVLAAAGERWQVRRTVGLADDDSRWPQVSSLLAAVEPRQLALFGPLSPRDPVPASPKPPWLGVRPSPPPRWDAVERQLVVGAAHPNPAEAW